jgi:hypothetical protein
MSDQGYYPPPPPPAVAPTEPKAVWALVCAIVGFFLCPIVLPVVGLVLANQSLAAIRAAPGYWAGEGLAKAARILSIVALVLGVIGAIAAIVWFGVVARTVSSELDRQLDDGGTVSSDAFDYGDDATLDQLWDSCEAGDGQACDDLYFQSPPGSQYEQFGDTCGNRFEAGTVVCTSELE